MRRDVASWLLLALACGSGLVAQEPPPRDSQLLDTGVPVRPVDDISLTERLGIVFERALLPRKKIVEPLYAYDSDLVCGKQAKPEDLLAHEGTVAIVVVSVAPETDIALYRPTMAEAVRDAIQNWCDSDREWFFATTYPVGERPTTTRYLSREIDRIDAALLAFGSEEEETIR